MRFAISIPQHVGEDGFDPGAFRSHVERVEQLGFHSAWTQEQVLGSARTLSPLETMTYAAACTSRLRLGCAVFVTPLHNPLHLAKAICSLDHLSGGRLDVGVVAGGSGRPFAAFGVDADRPVARFDEGISLMKALWTQREVSFDGRIWKLDRAAMEPKPVQEPHPPIWVGGNHPDALRRAARIGDGFIGAGSQTTAAFVEQVTILRAELAERDRDRDPSTFAIGKRVYVHVEDDRSRARRRIAAALAYHYGRSGLDAAAVAGPPEECVAGLREVADAGAETILLNPLVDDAEQVERLAAEVVPALL
ncbi:MAG: LLM class flavin-dependent oxidoreductase [Solirubrobacteraceae bacterium]